jgi:hypothetical protein
MAKKVEVVGELDGLRKEGHHLRPYKASEKKADLEALLEETRKLAEGNGDPVTTVDVATVEVTEAPTEDEAPTMPPVHPDACSDEYKLGFYGYQEEAGHHCKSCLESFAEAYAQCGAATIARLAAEGVTKQATGTRGAVSGKSMKSVRDFEALSKFLAQPVKDLNTTCIFDRLCLRGGKVSKILAQFKPIALGRDYKAFTTASYARNHIRYRIDKARFIYEVEPNLDNLDPYVRLVGVGKSEGAAITPEPEPAEAQEAEAATG